MRYYENDYLTENVKRVQKTTNSLLCAIYRILVRRCDHAVSFANHYLPGKSWAELNIQTWHYSHVAVKDGTNFVFIDLLRIFSWLPCTGVPWYTITIVCVPRSLDLYTAFEMETVHNAIFVESVAQCTPTSCVVSSRVFII